jgi:hypothetical protein
MTRRSRQKMGRLAGRCMAWTVCASSIASSGCVVGSAEQAFSNPIRVTITAESPVEIGSVSVVYVSVTSSEAVQVGIPLAMREPGTTQVQSLDLDTAIKKAGGMDKLAPVLSHGTSAMHAALRGIGVTFLFTTIDLIVLPVLAASTMSTSSTATPNIAKAVLIPPVGDIWSAQHRALVLSQFGGGAHAISVEGTTSGYMFFPRDHYDFVQVPIDAPGLANPLEVRIGTTSAFRSDLRSGK